MELADILTKIVKQNIKVDFRFAEVTAHNSSSSPKTCDLKLSGTDTVLAGIRYMHNYNPTVSDIVLVLVNNKDIIVFGHLEG